MKAGSGSLRVVVLGVKLFAFILMTLVNYPVYLPILGVMILAAFRPAETIVIGIRGLAMLSMLFLTLAIFGIKFWAYDAQFAGAGFAGSFINNFIAFSVLSCILVYMIGYAERHTEELLWLVRGALVFHLLVFMFQFGAYYGGGIYIDLFQMLTGKASRTINNTGDIVEGLGSLRMTGLVLEPSNYASIIYLLGLISVGGRRGKSFDWIVLPIVAVMFFTFSTLGALLSLVLLAYSVLVVSNFRRLVLIGGVLGVCGIAFVFVFQEQIFLQIDKGLNTYGIRLQALVFIFERSGVPLYLGHGPFGVEAQLALKASGFNAAREISTLSDAGLMIFLMFQFGMLGLLFYILLLFSVGRSLSLFVLMFMATLTKFEFSQVLLLVVIAFLVSEGRQLPRRSRARDEDIGERIFDD